MGRPIILVEKISRWNMPILRVLTFFGYDIHYMFYPEHLKMDGATCESIESRLKRKGFFKFHFCKNGGADTYGYAKHSPVYAKTVFNDLLGTVDFATMADLFVGVEHGAEKLPTLFYDQIVSQALEVGNIISVANALSAKGRRVYIFRAASPVQKRIFSERISGYKNVYPVFMSSGLSLVGKVMRIARRIWQKGGAAIKAASACRADKAHAPEETDAAKTTGPLEPPPVAFFPYKGVVYNNLFYKDQYYDDDPQSPFHKSRILHIEMREDIPDLAELSTTYYREEGLRLAFMDSGLGLDSATAKLLLRTFRRAWRAVSGVRKVSDRVLAVAVLMRGYVQFLRGWKNLAVFDGVKVALIGFDYLFPTAQALALQARGIKVVAMQERFILTFHDSFHPVFDTYFVSGPRVSERLNALDFHWVGEALAIGLVRAERLKQYRSDSNPVVFEKTESPKKLVVVLDFHSYRDPFTDGDNSMICWEVNKAFYRDILELAELNPDAHFVIRGKNVIWCSIPFFADIMAQIEAMPNVEVNSDYEEVYVSYKLVAKAALVIGRATSLGDEALSVGVPVLFHDFTPLRRSNVSEICDYDGFPIYVHTFDELAQRTRAILDEGEYADEQEFGRLREKNYYASNPSPKQTMMDHLHAML